MGHALNGSIQDACIRIARMRGKRTKWIYGTDHAGIATERQVEQALAEEGTTKEEIGRERFVERVALAGALRLDDHRAVQALGASLDYADERFTMDEAYARAVTGCSFTCSRRGFVTRDQYLVNWDPGLRTAISDLRSTSARSRTPST